MIDWVHERLVDFGIIPKTYSKRPPKFIEEKGFWDIGDTSFS